jgi:hypothetical protein
LDQPVLDQVLLVLTKSFYETAMTAVSWHQRNVA